MNPEITKFRIEKLYGHRTIDLQIKDNKLILVGENGTGKSTVANLIFYFLTCQWSRIQDYQLDKIIATIDGEDLIYIQEKGTTSEERRWKVWRQRLIESGIPNIEIARLEELFRVYDLNQIIHFPEQIIARSGSTLPSSLVSMIASEFRETASTRKDRKSNDLESITKKIRDKFRVLYLPTYRRIEQDLQSVLDLREESEFGRRELRRVKDRVLAREKQYRYLELVEFGMSDVERTISSEMVRLKENIRTGLNTLTGTYLKDVIGGKHLEVTLKEIAHVGEDELNSILDRIGEQILPRRDKQRLKVRVAQMKDSKKIKSEDKVVAHFLSRLLKLYNSQQEAEKDVIEFVAVCNKYLVGKTIEYDHKEYRIFIRNSYADSSKVPNEIAMSKLSSGEKQIVSLFSHIYLSHMRDFFVIIDEPELSLSVPWQKNLLPDIYNSGRCNGLVAVTHSPFIFNNEFNASVRSLEEFMEA